MLTAERLPNNPIIEPDPDAPHGTNINGPSVIRVPDWIDQPLGTYYLYFAHHQGEYIRLAYADDITGPWTIHDPGTLGLSESYFDNHIASPDVHLHPADEDILMYYHGCCGSYLEGDEDLSQFSRLAWSEDGIDFSARPRQLGRFYFRVFKWDDAYYALSQGSSADGRNNLGVAVYRSSDGITNFERGPSLLNDGARHTAVRLTDSTLQIFYSRIGDCPEHILWAEVDLTTHWTDWDATSPQSLLKPEHDYEGVDQPLEPSEGGASHEPVRQLRDPAIFEEGGQTYLFYSVAGERGIAAAKLME